MFREVRVYEIKEVLRLWLRGEGLRKIERLSSVDRKTVRRYVAAAVEAGLDRAGGEEQLNDVLLAQVCEAVRPHRPDGHGAAWAVLVANHEQLKAWVVAEGLTAVKAHELLARQGTVVPERTLHGYALEVLGVGRSARTTTVRVADGEPGGELQVDFGRMGLVPDPDAGRCRVCHALIFTACYSRHCFVWLTFTQTTAAMLAGFEAAWAFFGGVFAIVIPDNMATIVETAHATEPRLNQAFVEYAQARGSSSTRPGSGPRPTSLAWSRPSRSCAIASSPGSTSSTWPTPQRRAQTWCSTRAGLRIHGTTQCRPVELFAVEEAPRLAPAPTAPYDLPVYATAKVHRDHHIEVAKALYSIPGNLISQRVDVRVDRALVRVFCRGALVKVHPRTAPGGRITDPADLPAERTTYAMRDLDALARMAAKAGPAVGAYATAVLDHPLPWTKMRQVYVLLGLVKRWGAERVDAACARALEAEAVSVGLIGRMLEKGTESSPAEAPAPAPEPAGKARFTRDAEHFATKRPAQNSGTDATGGAA